MSKRALLFFLTIFMLGSSASLQAAETVVVSDYLPINVRKGTGPRDGIIAAVKSGDRLVVLDREPGYLKIRTPKGNEGWVLERFTQKEPIASEKLAAAEAAMKAAVEKRDAAEKALAELRAKHQSLLAEHQELQSSAETLARDLDRVSEAAASTLEIQARNEELETELAEVKAASADAREKISSYQLQRSQWLFGAGILVAGLLLGLILPMLRPRRSAWSSY